MGVRHGSDRPERLRFGNFEVDLDTGELRKNGLRVKLPDQAFEVLTALLERAGEVVTREQLQQKLWPADTLVDFDHGLNKTINRIREALCDSASTPRFLETLPRRGYRFIGTVEQILPSAGVPDPAVTMPVSEAAPKDLPNAIGRRHILGMSTAALGALAGGISTAMLRSHNKPAAPVPTHTSILIDQGGMTMANVWAPVLSPDGTRLVFGGPQGLWVRPLDSLTGRPVPNTDAAQRAFWSPDGRFIAFWVNGTILKKIEVPSGYPVTIGDFSLHARGGTWSRYDVILFAAFNPGPIYRVSAAGGTPQAVTRIDGSRGEIGHRWPFFLPDGRHFLYSARVSLGGPPGETNEIRVASLDGGTDRFLLYADSNAIYAQGYLLFVRDHRLMAEPFGDATASITGAAVVVAESIVMLEDSGAFSASASGALLYQTGADPDSRLVWLDRTGKQIGSLAGHYYRPHIAPGGGAIAVDALDDGKVNRDLWIYLVSGGTGTRLTSDHLIHTHPIWSPDGQRIVFAGGGATPDAERDLYVRNAAADARNELLLNTPGDKTPSDWSADGRFIAYQLRDKERTTLSLWVLPLFGSRKPFEFHPSAFARKDGQFSPDGRWMAYTSDDSGREEVYVAGFPEGGTVRKVSINGGSQPRWRRDGHEIFYLSPDNKLMSAVVRERGAALYPGDAHRLFDCQPARVGIGSVYDVSADGQRFVISTRIGKPAPPATLVTNWTDELPR
jgi:Tol biopolymer transport system component/DNA-binding winged helix-turn-helix (wHTH) protein